MRSLSRNAPGALVAILLAFGLVACLRPLLRPSTALYGRLATVPDTVLVNRPYVPPRMVANVRPERVTVFEKPDTALRQRMDTSAVVIGVQVKPTSVVVQTIDPKGIVHSASYAIPAFAEVEIGTGGEVEVRPRHRRLRRVAALASGIALAAGALWLVTR